MARTRVQQRKRKRTAATATATSGSSCDHTEKLPDAILIVILSLLPIDQAARTSIVSTRWRNLWKHVETLEFNYKNIPHFIPINALTLALRSHQGATCREVRIRLTTVEKEPVCQHHIARWFRFVYEKSVEKMELVLPTIKPEEPEDREYFFPRLRIPTLSSLNYISLHSWSLDSGNLGHLLRNCPNLYHMIICGSHRLCYPIISSNSLRKLEILGCFLLKELVLDARNLLSFKFHGSCAKIRFVNVPFLREVSFLEANCSYFAAKNFEQFAPVLDQLETVKLTMTFPWFSNFKRLDKLNNVKNLELKIKVWGFQKTFTLFASMVEGLPKLNKLKFHMFWPSDFTEAGILEPMSNDKKHYSLRIVELIGFTGNALDTRIAQYLIKNAVSLESFRIHVCREAHIDVPEDLMGETERGGARCSASRELGPLVRPHTRFLVT